MSKEITQEEIIDSTVEKKCPLPWWKRIGFLGFMFFLIKGLGWLAIFAITAIWGPEALTAIQDFFANLF